MKRQPWVSFLLAGVSLTSFGFSIPSPFSNLDLSNSEIESTTSWTLTCTIGGDSDKKVNSAAFEALLYSAAQSSAKYRNASGIPVSFSFGWLDDDGNVEEYLSYQGFTLQFKVSTSGRYLTYALTGLASLAVSFSTPVVNIPAVSGWVQPSAVLVGVAQATRATDYYDLDVDRSDNITYVQHGPLCTSFNSYVRGTYNGSDDYDNFPGLVRLSTSYNFTRDASGLADPHMSLRNVLDNVNADRVSSYLKASLTDNTVQCSTFSYWVDEPTMTRRGCIHYKSNNVLLNNRAQDTLEFGTSHTNILTLSGSYNGVAYNMTNMQFSDIGFNLDSSGQAIANTSTVVNSWSADVGDVYQTANIINDINAIASQFSGDFTVEIPGSIKRYQLAQPVSLLVMSGNTISPVTGVYNIVSVSHRISNTFVTTLKLQRYTMSSANQVAASQNIYLDGSQQLLRNTKEKTSNVVSPYKVDFGTIYPDFTYLYSSYCNEVR